MLMRLVRSGCLGPNHAEMADFLKESICLSHPRNWFHFKLVWATKCLFLRRKPFQASEKKTGFLSSTNAIRIFDALRENLSAFGAVALLLAMMGLYGVISYSASRRTSEIGIRMALGAGRRDVTKLGLRQGMLLTAIGMAIGLLISFAVTRLLSGLLYGIKASDPLTYCAITLFLLAVAFGACLLPSRRAASVEPMQALRAE